MLLQRNLFRAGNLLHRLILLAVEKVEVEVQGGRLLENTFCCGGTRVVESLFVYGSLYFGSIRF